MATNRIFGEYILPRGSDLSGIDNVLFKITHLRYYDLVNKETAYRHYGERPILENKIDHLYKTMVLSVWIWSGLMFGERIIVADPEFPVGGVDPFGGHGPPTRAFFGENTCENERIGSRRANVRLERPLDQPMILSYAKC